MPDSSLLGDDPWVAILLSDARAALDGGRRLRGGERRIDGPFALWDGKAGTVPVTIFVTEPGGASSWFAATKLAMRRFRPTLVIGLTPLTWCGDAEPSGALVASTVLDLSPIELDLASAEVTATRGLPERIAARVNGRELAGYESAAAQSFLRTFGGGPMEPGRNSKGESGEKSVEPGASGGVTSPRRRLDIGTVGCWNRDGLESGGVARWLVERRGILAVDNQSAGLAEAANECGVSWVAMGPCLPIADPARAGRGAGPTSPPDRGAGASLAETLLWLLDGIRSHQEKRG